MEEKAYPLVNAKIRDRRLELGLSDTEVAYRARLNIYEFRDVEAHADEAFVVVPLYHLKKICTTLKMDFLGLFEIPCAFCGGAPFLDDYRLRRDVLVRKKREELALSAEQLGDKIGFHGAEIELLETYTAHLESWVIEHILDLGHQLGIPPQVLLDVECQACKVSPV